eukprot:CAMPEP_0118970748 /NCGR_PEP_ID=MMETSP1173-20130426/7561_1 /TAXON_ID=1034831 /ORGANISM="Rhizochromulina marina cf, Strain CCMP1243" /LENGTH=417 /DNA_ID=CAMNT_0006920139 /DNA_START=28 /DNA_END=1281 /DNA_ORIENTATION=-
MKCTRAACLLALAAFAHTASAGWIDSKELKQQVQDATLVPAKRYSLNLDLDPKERWNDIAADFKDEAYKITDYLKDSLPPHTLPLVVKIAGAIEPYFTDYGDEMIGLADALDLPLGEIVAVNLVYELERIGVNCSNWNNTGPTLDDDAIPRGLSCGAEQAAYEARRAKALETGPEGYCTSIVSMDDSNTVLHSRNMDWNVPDTLKDFIIDVDAYKGGELIFTGTCAVGFVGMLNGVRHKGEAWSISLDARGHGGRIPVNLLEALKRHAMTPEQLIRKTLESDAGNDGFEAAIEAVSHVPTVNEAYFIMAGSGPTDGAVVTRARNRAVDVWRIDETDPTGWWRVETNYDHWNPVPKADDRRDPANQNMEALGSPSNVNVNSMLEVMSTWPTLNPHTTFTTFLHPASGLHNTSIWYGLD